MSNWELALYLVALFGGLVPLYVYARRLGKRGIVLLVAVVGVAGIAGTVFYRPMIKEDAKPILLSQTGLNANRFLPRRVKEGGFVSSDQCRSCHPEHYASWRDSFHRSMTQVATPESVLAPFDGVQLDAPGFACRLERRGNEFWAEMPDMDVELSLQDAGYDLTDLAVRAQIPIVSRRIVMTTGSHHFQVYWVAGRNGLNLIQFPFTYNISEEKWSPAEDVFIRPPNGDRRFAIWNANCIQCHSLNGKPKADTTGFLSTSTELGISCEACHGPGEEHIRKHQNPLTRFARHLSDHQEPDETIVNPVHCAPAVSSQICGQCHSSFVTKDPADWSLNGLGYVAGGSLEEKRFLFHFNSDHARELNEEIAATAFWQDGTSRGGGREYLAMVASPCFKTDDQVRQMSCLSCHSMHHSDPNDQLREDKSGNETCLQCHDSYRKQLESHTHHSASSSGSLCYNCHMPHTSYALLKAIRSHRIEIPNVTTSSRTGKPNGCNQCHLDETLAWTAEHLSDWYGLETEELSDDEKEVAASILWLLRGDAAQRAITAWTFGWSPAREASGDEWMAPFLAQLMSDPYSAVRFIAFDALRKSPEFSDLSYDYISSEEKRFQAIAEVFQHWERNARDRTPNNTTQLLISPSGSLQRDVFRRIFQERDDRPIEFPE